MISTGYILQEKEINGLIQQIMGRQNQGNTESRQIQSQLVSVQNKLDATHAQIHTTRANLHDVMIVSSSKQPVL